MTRRSVGTRGQASARRGGTHRCWTVHSLHWSRNGTTTLPSNTNTPATCSNTAGIATQREREGMRRALPLHHTVHIVSGVLSGSNEGADACSMRRRPANPAADPPPACGAGCPKPPRPAPPPESR